MALYLTVKCFGNKRNKKKEEEKKRKRKQKTEQNTMSCVNCFVNGIGVWMACAITDCDDNLSLPDLWGNPEALPWLCYVFFEVLRSLVQFSAIPVAENCNYPNGTVIWRSECLMSDFVVMSRTYGSCNAGNDAQRLPRLPECQSVRSEQPAALQQFALVRNDADHSRDARIASFLFLQLVHHHQPALQISWCPFHSGMEKYGWNFSPQEPGWH